MTLRDRLPVGLSSNLAVELPLLVRGIYFDQYEPEEQPEAFRTQSAFYERVEQRVDPTFHFDGEASTKAVFAVLSHHLSDGILEKVRAAPPEDVRDAWAGVEAA